MWVLQDRVVWLTNGAGQKDARLNMKRLVLLASLAVMATVPAFAKSNLFDDPDPKPGELFGYKFGDRMPANAAVLPSGDGMLLSQIDPKHPEFFFQQYFVCLLPETRVIVGFSAADTFQDDEFAKCNIAYVRCKKAIETHFGKKMKSFPPSKAGLTDQQTVLQNCGVELADKKFMMLQTIKNEPGGYIVRMIFLDIKAIQKPVEKAIKEADSLPALEGLFGRKLAARVPVSADEELLANGMYLQLFEPEKKFLDFNVYALHILPRSRKICEIVAITDFADRHSAIACHAEVCRLLEKKFGRKITDASSNFDTTKPDADGEQMIKCSVIVFPNAKRGIEAHCLWDVDDKVFRVRIAAIDILLLNAVESEKRETNKNSDAKALDAL